MPDCTGSIDKEIEKALKKACSHNQITPSEDFTSLQYLDYLRNATPAELERDIVFKDTYLKIVPKL